VTDPTAAEVGLEAVRAAAGQRGVAAEACALAAEQRATPENQVLVGATGSKSPSRGHPPARRLGRPGTTRKVGPNTRKIIRNLSPNTAI
jgi:hypothetical protein